MKNIRNAGNNIQINNRGDLRDAKIGTLTVLPYFKDVYKRQTLDSWGDGQQARVSELMSQESTIKRFQQSGFGFGSGKRQFVVIWNGVDLRP